MFLVKDETYCFVNSVRLILMSTIINHMNIDPQKYQCCLFVTAPDLGFQVYLGKTQPFTLENKYTLHLYVGMYIFHFELIFDLKKS